MTADLLNQLQVHRQATANKQYYKQLKQIQVQEKVNLTLKLIL